MKRTANILRPLLTREQTWLTLTVASQEVKRGCREWGREQKQTFSKLHSVWIVQAFDSYGFICWLNPRSKKLAKSSVGVSKARGNQVPHGLCSSGSDMQAGLTAGLTDEIIGRWSKGSCLSHATDEHQQVSWVNRREKHFSQIEPAFCPSLSVCLIKTEWGLSCECHVPLRVKAVLTNESRRGRTATRTGLCLWIAPFAFFCH